MQQQQKKKQTTLSLEENHLENKIVIILTFID